MIDETLWSDNRYIDLVLKCGNRHMAKGMIVEAFSLAHKYWVDRKNPRQLVPKEIFLNSGLQFILDVNLAKIENNCVYVRGIRRFGDKRLELIEIRAISGSKGGLAKASNCLANANKKLANPSKLYHVKVNVDNKEQNTSLSEQYSDEVINLTSLLASLILNNNPNAKIPSNLGKWHKEMDRLMKIDNECQETIEAVVKWSQKDAFWKSNILSVPKLREKFQQLKLRMGVIKPKQEVLYGVGEFKYTKDGRELN